MDCSLPASSVHWISQARLLEWVAISFSRGLPDLGVESESLTVAGGFFTTNATWVIVSLKQKLLKCSLHSHFLFCIIAAFSTGLLFSNHFCCCLILSFQTISLVLCLTTACFGFRWWLRWYSICLQWRRPGFNPWVRKISWRRKWQATPVFLPGKSHGQRSLVGYSPWGHKRQIQLSN